jgi:hypothetical protein
MGMDYRVHVRPHSINQQVHRDFARYTTSPRQNAPTHIDHNQILQPRHALTNRCGRDEKCLAIEPHRQVAIRGSDIPMFM